jgi:alanyl-tRNA synthetase
VRGRMPGERPAVVAGGGVVKGRPQIVVVTNEEARRWGLAAGDLVRTGAAALGGSGGGKPDVAQGGGTDPDRIGEALRRIEYAVGERVTAGR